MKRQQGLKPVSHFTAIGPTKVVPCYKTLPIRPLDSGAGAKGTRINKLHNGVIE